MDLRLSSFKRVGKLLELMHKRGVLEYAEVKGVEHKLLTRVHIDKVKEYTPKYSLKRVSAAKREDAAEDTGYPKVNIEEIYEPNKQLN